MEFCLENVSKIYPAQAGNTHALNTIHEVVRAGEFVVLVGPSGCGKSTLLKLAAGLERPTSGRLYWCGMPRTPRTAMVFQEGGLFPWLTVRENVAVALESTELSSGDKEKRITERLAFMGLEEFADAYPETLSGGMRQRVGIARAWVTEPDLLLMDEPFSALDAQTRRLMEEELIRYREIFRPATLYVTHHIPEAVHLADRIWVFSHRPGEIIAHREISIPPAQRRQPEYREEIAALEEDIWELIRTEADLRMRGNIEP